MEMTSRKASPWTWLVAAMLVLSVYVVAYCGLVKRYKLSLSPLAWTSVGPGAAKTRTSPWSMATFPRYSSNPSVDSILIRVFFPIHSLDCKIRREHWQVSP